MPKWTLSWLLTFCSCNYELYGVRPSGGGTGIGLGLAERFLSAGSTVVVTGRRQEVLDEAKSKFPALHTFANNVSKASEREALAAWAVKEFPKLNVLVSAGAPGALLDCAVHNSAHISALHCEADSVKLSTWTHSDAEYLASDIEAGWCRVRKFAFCRPY